MKFRLALATAALLAASSTTLTASAQQPWVDDPDMGEGEGIPIGELDFHPSLAGEFGYDSNYLRRGPNDLAADGSRLPVVDTLRLRITPSLTLNTRHKHRSVTEPPPMVLFKLNTVAAASYNVFIPLDSTNEFNDRNRLGGGADLGFEVFPYRVVTWDVEAGYRRTIDPSSVATGDFDFDRHTLTAGTGVTWRPGGGLFEWRAGYDWMGTYFSEGDYNLFNNGQHTISTRGRWRFLPRTAWLFDAHYRFLRYADQSTDQIQNDGEIVRSRLGIAGLVTNRFAFRVMAGWAASFYDARNGFSPQNFDGPVGNAEIKWFVTPAPGESPDSAPVGLSSIALGFEHDYGHSYLGPFYQTDRGYLTFRYFIGQVVVTSLQGYVAHISYPDFVITPGGQVYSGVAETRIGARLFAEYRAARNVGINTTISYDQNISGNEFELNPTDPMDQSRDDLAYSRFQAFAGVRVFW